MSDSSEIGFIESLGCVGSGVAIGLVPMLFSFFAGCLCGGQLIFSELQRHREEARDAGVGCYDPQTGDFVYDKDCPFSEPEEDTE